MKPNYHSWLLRLWRVGEGENARLAASLEDPHSHQLRHFAGLDALCDYLHQHMQDDKIENLDKSDQRSGET